MELSHSFQSFMIANCVVLLASVVQTSTGMGFALIAMPLLALISLEFVPGPMLFVNLFLALFMLNDGRSYIVRREITFLLPTILIGTVIGAGVLMQFEQGTLGILFASLILLSVFISLFVRALPLSSPNLVFCGVAVGIMGTSAGLPGAPLVVLYQNESMEKTRPTMALVFAFAYITSLTALAFTGAFSIRLALDGLFLLPGLVFGFMLGKWGRQYLTRAMGRILMLFIGSFGAILLFMKSVSG
jgi:uncharacterized membrane protein YfcA